MPNTNPVPAPKKVTLEVGQPVEVRDPQSIYNRVPCFVTGFADEAQRIVFARPSKLETSEVFSKWQLIPA